MPGLKLIAPSLARQLSILRRINSEKRHQSIGISGILMRRRNWPIWRAACEARRGAYRDQAEIPIETLGAPKSCIIAARSSRQKQRNQ